MILCHFCFDGGYALVVTVGTVACMPVACIDKLCLVGGGNLPSNKACQDRLDSCLLLFNWHAGNMVVMWMCIYEALWLAYID